MSDPPRVLPYAQEHVDISTSFRVGLFVGAVCCWIALAAGLYILFMALVLFNVVPRGLPYVLIPFGVSVFGFVILCLSIRWLRRLLRTSSKALAGQVLPALACILTIACTGCAGHDRGAVDTGGESLAERGWSMWRRGLFAGEHAGGHYVDAHSATRVSDFWSDGHLAKVDLGDDGHFERIYVVRGDRLQYVGTLGKRGTFMSVDPAFPHLEGRRLEGAGLK